MPTKAQHIRHCDVDGGMPCFVWHIVEVALRIRMMQVDRRRNNAVQDALNGDGRLDRAVTATDDQKTLKFRQAFQGPVLFMNVSF